MGLWKSISAALGLTPRRKRPPDLYKSGVFPWHDHGPGTWQCCPRDVEGPVAQPIDIRVKTTALLPNSRLIPQDAGQQQQLAQLRLPVLQSLDDLLAWLGLDLGPFLALANPSDRARPNKTNYIEWTVPKKRGGVRIISSPKPRLKAVQYHVQRDILARVAPHEAAHGFVPGRNIFSNAAPHVGQALVMNLDLRHFFHYVTYPRVVGVFRWLGYSKEVSRGLALLCTHRPMLSPVYWIGGLAPTALWRAGRHAVAGAPTSPALANLCVYRLDNRLTGLAKKFEAVYTRYADDLTFSGPAAFKRGMKRFLPLVLRIIRDEGFRQNRRKLRFMRPGHRQEVTGLVVNQKVNTRRADYDRIKAIIHNARKAGSLESQNRAGHPAFRAHLLGRIASVRHVNPERGQRLLAALDDVP